MKNFIKTFNLKVFMLLAASMFLMTACGDDEGTTGNEQEYTLFSASDPDIEGSVTFREMEDGSTEVFIDLDGTEDGDSHPAHIHLNSAVEGGGIHVPLNSVDGDSGESTTQVSATEAGASITYDDLIAFDGHVNVHLSASELSTLIAQGDIGQNELTGESKSYNLVSVDVTGISGQAVFEERANGEALATLSLMGTSIGGEHPAHIHENSAEEGGGIIFSFNPVDGDTGGSRTNVSSLDNGDDLTYDDILVIDGYINVHMSAADLGTIIAQGNIGINE